MLGLLAAALLMAVGIDTALWHHNLQRRDMERRAHAWEQRATELAGQLQDARDQLSASQQQSRALHDELILQRDEPGSGACTVAPEVVR
jgi:hypothetical protein